MNNDERDEHATDTEPVLLRDTAHLGNGSGHKGHVEATSHVAGPHIEDDETGAEIPGRSLTHEMDREGGSWRRDD